MKIQPKKVAGLLQSIGAKNSPDTVLAHITPEEAALLKARGGSGRRDKVTGLLHFEDDSSSDSTGGDSSYSGSYGGFSGSGWGDDSGDAYSTSGNSDGYSNVGGWGGSSGDAYGMSPYGLNGQSYEPMYPAQYKTLGGSLFNAFGGDPQGVGANLADFGIGAIGALNPVAGSIGKIAQSYLKSQSLPSSMGSSGNTGSRSLLSSLMPSSLFNSGSVVPGVSSPGIGQTRTTSSGQSNGLLWPLVNRIG